MCDVSYTKFLSKIWTTIKNSQFFWFFIVGVPLMESLDGVIIFIVDLVIPSLNAFNKNERGNRCNRCTKNCLWFWEWKFIPLKWDLLIVDTTRLIYRLINFICCYSIKICPTANKISSNELLETKDSLEKENKIQPLGFFLYDFVFSCFVFLFFSPDNQNRSNYLDSRETFDIV